MPRVPADGVSLAVHEWPGTGPATNRLGIEFPSLDVFLGIIRSLPMFAGRWNDYLERYFRYEVETLPSGAVRSNHCTVLLGKNPRVKSALQSFLKGPSSSRRK